MNQNCQSVVGNLLNFSGSAHNSFIYLWIYGTSGIEVATASTFTHIRSSSWPRQRFSLRPSSGRCCRSRCWSDWSWWSTRRWCRPTACSGRPPTFRCRWRWSGTACPPFPPACTASCLNARCWFLHQWLRNRRCCTCQVERKHVCKIIVLRN